RGDIGPAVPVEPAPPLEHLQLHELAQGGLHQRLRAAQPQGQALGRLPREGVALEVEGGLQSNGVQVCSHLPHLPYHSARYGGASVYSMTISSDTRPLGAFCTCRYWYRPSNQVRRMPSALRWTKADIAGPIS